MPSILIAKPRLNYEGGAEKNTRRLIDAYCARGIFPTVLTTGALPTFADGVEAISAFYGGKFAKRNLLRFEKAICSLKAKKSFHMVFGGDISAELTHFRAGVGCQMAYIERRKSVEPWYKRLGLAFNGLLRAQLRLEEKLIASLSLRRIYTNSQMVADEFFHHYGISPSLLKVFHNAPDWDRTQSAFEGWEENHNQLRLRYNVPPGPCLLFMGNNYVRKGLIFALDALALLKHEPWTLIVAGKEKSPQKFMKYASKKGIAHKIRFFPRAVKPWPLYQLADVFLCPSIYDPFANVTVEALSMGLFVISSAYNGGKEVLTPENGSVIENLYDKEAFSCAIQKALMSPKKDRANAIRKSIRHLDSAQQYDAMVEDSLLSL